MNGTALANLEIIHVNYSGTNQITPVEEGETRKGPNS